MTVAEGSHSMSALSSDTRGVLTPCRQCGRVNRLRYSSLGKATRCAQCHADLASPSNPVDVPSMAAFDALVTDADLPVLVDFWAAWCGPCRALAPELEKFALGGAGAVVVAKVNTETLPELAERFGIRSIPTLALFAQGAERARHTGVLSLEGLRAFVASGAGSPRRG